MKANPLVFNCNKCGMNNELFILPFDGIFQCKFCNNKIDILKLHEQKREKASGSTLDLTQFGAGSLVWPLIEPIAPTITVFVRNNSEEEKEVMLFNLFDRKIDKDVLVKVLCKKNNRNLMLYNTFLDYISTDVFICRLLETTDNDQLEFYAYDLFEGKKTLNNFADTKPVFALNGAIFCSLILYPKQTFTIHLDVTAKQVHNFISA